MFPDMLSICIAAARKIDFYYYSFSMSCFDRSFSCVLEYLHSTVQGMIDTATATACDTVQSTVYLICTYV